MREARFQSLVIQTPEGVSFPLLLAGPATRFLAWSLDLACISVISSLLATVLLGFSLVSRDFASALITFMYFAVSIGYGIIMEWFWRGQTVGKYLLRLRVVDEQGLRLQFSQIMIRNLLRFVDVLPGLYLVGGLASLLSAKAQRLGDYAAGTVVIRSRPALPEELARLEPAKYNSFRDYPHLEARLRQRLSPEETSLALAALLRRPELEDSARLALFRSLADHFRAQVAFPADAGFGLTDEQYVRNVVDSVYWTPGREKS